VSNTSGVSTVKTGKVTAIAVLGDKRLREIPDVPIMSELIANVERPGDWLGFFGPAGLPAPILSRLHAEIVKAVNLPDVVVGLQAAGMEVFADSPEDFRRIVLRDIELYRKMVPLLGIQPE